MSSDSEDDSPKEEEEKEEKEVDQLGNETFSANGEPTECEKDLRGCPDFFPNRGTLEDSRALANKWLRDQARAGRKIKLVQHAHYKNRAGGYTVEIDYVEQINLSGEEE